jgi:hypothetical protein
MRHAGHFPDMPLEQQYVLWTIAFTELARR